MITAFNKRLSLCQIFVGEQVLFRFARWNRDVYGLNLSNSKVRQGTSKSFLYRQPESAEHQGAIDFGGGVDR